ncbi:MAG: ABC transporter ATP-binding protein [Bacillota bacterium]
MALIEAENLTKEFSVRAGPTGGNVRETLRSLLRPRHDVISAVRDVSLSISSGEAVAYMGPNGAGKSTTVKLLSGILTPTRGTVRVCDLTPWKQRTRLAAQIGAVFGQRSQLLWDLPVRESFRFLGTMYEIPSRDFASRLSFSVQMLDIGDLLHKPVRELSLGQKVKCEIAAVLLHRPALLLLDEPTIGLDFMAKDRVRAALRYTLKELGMTILLASHDFGDVEAICERAILLVNGAVKYDGSLDVLRGMAGTTRVIEFTLASVADTGALQSLPEADFALNGVTLTASFDRDKVSSSAVLTHVLSRFDVTDVRVQEPTLENAIRKLYAAEGEV